MISDYIAYDVPVCVVTLLNSHGTIILLSLLWVDIAINSALVHIYIISGPVDSILVDYVSFFSFGWRQCHAPVIGPHPCLEIRNRDSKARERYQSHPH